MVVCQTDPTEGTLLFEGGMDSDPGRTGGWENGEGVRRREKGENRTEERTRASEGPEPVDPENPGEAYLRVLLEGAKVPLDTEVPMNSKPPWLDEELLKKGSEFTRTHLFGVLATHIPALAMALSFQFGLEPLIFTGSSDTPFKAFRRYFSTITRIMSWYETDFMDKKTDGYKNMAAVRIMHASIFRRMNEASEEELRSKTTVSGKGTGVWSTYLETLKKDFANMEASEPSCPFASLSSLSKKHEEVLYVNQLDLALTQFTFVSLNILYPDYFGVHGATDEQLEGYCHLWRCLGYLLGIKDRYNICSEDGLEATRERCRAVLEKWVKPGFRDLTPDWEHMFRCLLEGLNHYAPGNTFGGMMAHLMWVLDIPAPNLRLKMTWMETVMFYFHRFTLGFLLRIPGLIYVANYILRLNMKWSANLSPEWLKRKKAIVYDYEKVSSDKM